MRDKRSVVYMILVISTVLIVGYRKTYSSSVATFDLSFKGAASGGSLILADTANRSSRYVAIQTSPGESAESVAQRLADTINACHSAAASREPPHRFNLHRLWDGGYQASASGGTLKLPGPSGNYILAGTENGLGIPRPPLFLSCFYDEQKDEVVARWINPSDGYHFILVHCYWTDRGDGGVKLVAGKSTSFTIDRKEKPANVNDLDIWMIGYRDNIPSNAAAIHVSGHSQEEIYGIPFTGGIAPNWSVWSTAAKPEKTAFEQGEKYPNMRRYNPARALLTKPYYQVVKAPPKGVVHGVYRRFLGLTPGHTYRLTACLTTLEMDSVQGDWSLSLCAAHNEPDRTELTIQQLAGLATLPNGGGGPEAGRIAMYNRNNTTKSDFVLVFSGDEVVGGAKSSHITLPSGVDTITVWVRFSCSDPNGKVGFSGVKLEDISVIDNPKSAEQIEQEERRNEAALLRWLEEESR